MIATIFLILGIYLFVGFLFAIAFINKGAAKIDDAAQDMPWSLKLLLIPGAMAFWPFLLSKWMKA